jgi:outer membrane protein assembly factor BamB
MTETMKPIFSKRIMAAAVLAGSLFLSGCGLFGGDDAATPTVGNRKPVLSRIETGAQVDPSIASVAVVLPPAVSNDTWGQEGGNAAKSAGHVALSAEPSLVWQASIAGSSKQRRLAAAPVVGGGLLYVMDTTGTVNAFDAQTGARRWATRLEVGDGLSHSAFGGGVSLAAERVYASNGLGEVAALDAQTGSVVWSVKPTGPLRGAPTIAFNQVFVMSQDNQIFALDINDGSQVWQQTSSQGQTGVFGVAAPAAGQGSVIAGFSTGELTAYRYENGRELWSDALARTSISTEVGTLTDVDADPIIDNGRVFALGQGGRMAAYELVTGQRVWELNLAGISTPTIAGEWIFTLTDEARLLAIARSSGKVRWIAQLEQYRDPKDREGPIFWTGPVLAGGNLWVASSRGKLFRVAANSGSAQEYAELGAPVSLPPVVAGRMLYILDDDGRIRAYR